MTRPIRPSPGERSAVRIGPVQLDRLDLAGAVDAVERLVNARRGGAVFTANVDHVVRLRRDAAFRAAYAAADLRVADGMPLVWASRLLGPRLPGRVAGADLVLPLARRAAARGWRVFLVGGPAAAAERLGALGVAVVGHDARWIEQGGAGAAARAVARRVHAARADLVLAGLGAPKQELWIARHREALRPAVAVGVGAALAFVGGTLARAPGWMSAAGLEWAYRLYREPRRLWSRYLAGGLGIGPVLAGEVVRRLASPRARG